MADTMQRETRSRVMAAVRASRNKSTELKMLVIMRSAGITGWRRNSQLPGRPDLIFPKQHVAVFVDGCFWHGCPQHCRMPKSNRDYWEPKIARNKQRHKEVAGALSLKGWIVHRVWEHELADSDGVAASVGSLLRSSAAGKGNSGSDKGNGHANN